MIILGGFMSRYGIFTGDEYESPGGWDDLHKTSNSFGELMDIVPNLQKHREWIHIVDFQEGKKVYEWHKYPSAPTK